MNLSITKYDDHAVLTLEGELDTAASQQAEQSIVPLLCYNGDIVIDCARLTFISSSGLRLLLTIYKHTRHTNHQTTLAHASASIRDVFAISGFLQLFKVEE